MQTMTNSNSVESPSLVHPFERAGLGKAPFKFLGLAQQDRIYGEVILNRAEYERTGIALTTTPGGTCAYCGTAIKVLCQILSADGKRFHVGCDCVEKTGDKRIATAVKLATRKIDRAKRASKAAAIETEIATLLADDATRAKLAAIVLPNHYAPMACTQLERAEWLLPRCGATGKAKLLKHLKAVLA